MKSDKQDRRLIRMIFIMNLIFWVISIPVISQVTDDFSDGNFTESPAWTGDAGQFEVDAEYRLHLLSSGSDTSRLLTRNSRFDKTEWNFWVKLGFNTSVNNHARVYLAVDSLDPENGKALYLQIGGSSDSMTIVWSDHGLKQVVFRFSQYMTNHASNIIRFRILQETGGKWEAWMDTTGQENYFRDGTFTATFSILPAWFGVYCRYTSSNAIKCWFDDIYVGPIIYDTIKPWIASAEIIPDTLVQVRFSEPLATETALLPENYQLSGSENPKQVFMDQSDPSIVWLVFQALPPEGVVDSLRVKQVTDISGNTLNDTVVPVFYYRPAAYDILITEIQADPEPVVGLPAEEFIELYNRTSFPLNLKGWTLRFGSYTKVFPEIRIPPNGFLILSRTHVFQEFGMCLPLFTSSLSLANEGTALVLSDASKQVIHAVSYLDDWHEVAFKAEGGWSLEMMDTGNPCGCRENWRSSTDPKGGTPGTVNAAHMPNPDEVSPRMVHAWPEDAATLQVVFSESMDSLSLLESTSYYLLSGDEILYPESVDPVGPDFFRIELRFPARLDSLTTYYLRISGPVRDCVGNPVDTNRFIRVGFPSAMESGDLIINEILFDPVGDGSRFVEIYNRSSKVLDLKTLVMASPDNPENLSSEAVPVTTTGRLSFPGDYHAFTDDPDELGQRYRLVNPDAIITMVSFPSIHSDSGNIIIAVKDDFTIVDNIHYDEDQHYPLLISTEGISLERISPDQPAADPENWHSAAGTAGYATPGYQNSQQYRPPESDDFVSVTPEIFSPDNDGYEDVTAIRVREPEPGFSVRIMVWNSAGRLVRVLADHVYSGSDSQFFWDGMDDQNQKCPWGLYIIFVEILHPEGSVKRAKKPVAVVTRF
jgi:hypothetical protein